VATLLLASLLVSAAIAIKLDSADPVIFRQTRNGSSGVQFAIYKFRILTVLEDGRLLCRRTWVRHALENCYAAQVLTSYDDLLRFSTVICPLFCISTIGRFALTAISSSELVLTLLKTVHINLYHAYGIDRYVVSAVAYDVGAVDAVRKLGIIL